MMGELNRGWGSEFVLVFLAYLKKSLPNYLSLEIKDKTCKHNIGFGQKQNSYTENIKKKLSCNTTQRYTALKCYCYVIVDLS